MSFRGFVLRFVENLSRRKILSLLPILIAGAFGFYLSQGVEYKSEGVILLDGETFLASLTDVRSEGISFRSPGDIANEQLFGFLATDSFVQEVVDVAGVEDQIRPPGMDNGTFYDGVREAISTSSGGEEFLTVEATAGEPETAQRLASGTIETFIQWKIDADLAQSRLAEGFVEDLVVSYGDEVNRAQDSLSEWVEINPGPLRVDDRPVDEQLALQSLQNDIDEASDRYNNAITKREEARLASEQADADIRQSYTVLDQPQLSTSAENGPIDVVIMTLAFAMVGLFMSVAVLSIISASDPTVRFPTEVEEFLDAELLAIVPKVA